MPNPSIHKGGGGVIAGFYGIPYFVLSDLICVHTYLLRLVCDSTVEENILKKANQKRMLGDIAIEGGVFTTDFFKEVRNIQL